MGYKIAVEIYLSRWSNEYE